jgi:rhodanese-related sulfurtransferase
VAGSATDIVDNVSVEQTWAQLKDHPSSMLIDVRTAAEWSFVGVADLSKLGKRVIQVEWQNFPDGELNAGFVDAVQSALKRLGSPPDAELFFICRSGARSMMAAQAVKRAGHMHCHNVADGFEGHLDPERHRGRLGGWKAHGLPWVQG